MTIFTALIFILALASAALSMLLPLLDMVASL